MSSHVFHEIFLHLNWHTKHSAPLLVPELELAVHDILSTRLRKRPDASLLEIGGTPTHVHLAIQIDPTVAASELVQDLKGFSSYEVNRRHRQKELQWQRGYGVVSFSRRQLPGSATISGGRRNIMPAAASSSDLSGSPWMRGRGSEA